MVRTSLMRLLRRRPQIITARRYSRPMPRWTLGAVVLLALAASAPTGAFGQGGRDRGEPRTVEDSRHLWATVNVCDTAEAPNTIGIRGSMPGSRDGREVMWMRFEVQYFSTVDSKWHRTQSAPEFSEWVRAGQARFKARQAGRSIRFDPKSTSVLLRGVVTFEWRLNGEVVRRARKRTTEPHRSTAGSDPPGYTAANCTITA